MEDLVGVSPEQVAATAAEILRLARLASQSARALVDADRVGEQRAVLQALGQQAAALELAAASLQVRAKYLAWESEVFAVEAPAKAPE